MELVTLKLPENLYLTAWYNRPSNNITQNNLRQILTASPRAIAIGDLNARHRTWNCHRDNASGCAIHSYTQSRTCSVLFPDQPTHYPMNRTTPTTTDIAVVRNVRSLSELTAVNDLNSDHLPVLLTVGGATIHKHDMTIPDYHRADWALFRETLDRRLVVDRDLHDTDKIDTSVTVLTEAITYAKTVAIPTKKLTKTHADLLPREILNIIRERNRHRKRWQRQHRDDDRNDMIRLTREIRSRIWRHRNDTWHTKLTALNANDGSIWRLAGKLRKKFQHIPSFELHGQTIMTDKGKADALANDYATVHDIGLDILTNEQRAIVESIDLTRSEDETRIKRTTPGEIRTIIKAQSSLKAPGPDCIQNLLLKNLSRKAVVQLSYIVNAILQLQHFPTPWKSAVVVPIHKPGKPKNKPDSYRPISLLNTLSKVTETVIDRRYKRHVERRGLLIDEQFGFRKRHNTIQQVARLVTDVRLAFNRNAVTALMTLDLTKAFDRVWIDGLTYKLQRDKMPRPLTRLIYSYLTFRTFRVKINETYSNPQPILAGVPQGSVLGPHLFLHYINDLPTHEDTSLALFADDAAIYCVSPHAIIAQDTVQDHITELTPYLKTWKFDVNVGKCENILLTRRRRKHNIDPIELDGQEVPTKTRLKYLGVLLDSRLTFYQHIKDATHRAYGALRSLYALMTKRGLTQSNKLLLYKTIIRPTMTYAAPVWFGAARSNLKPLQVMQNKCTRLILNVSRYTRIRDMHEELNLPYVNDYLYQAADTFYKRTLRHKNRLIRHITLTRRAEACQRHTYPLPYATLDIFDKDYTDEDWSDSLSETD